MSKPTTLAGALAQAQASVSRVLKEDANSFHKYQYASAESLMQAWTEASAPVGLALVPISQSPSRDEAGTYWLHSEWLLMHSAGDTLNLADVWPIVPERGRPLDKAVASAKTSSLGYLLRALMVAPRVLPGDDMDDNARDTARQAAEAREVKAKAQHRQGREQRRQEYNRQPKANQPKCSHCKQPGHNVKTCPEANACPKWDESAFAAQCKESGLELSEVLEFLAHKKRPHPSQMQPDDRAKIVPWLTKPEGSKMLANYFINKAQEGQGAEEQ